MLRTPIPFSNLLSTLKLYCNMGLSYRKSIKVGKNVRLNVSKSGISPSFRTGFGTISSRGFSILTFIPGLVFRGSWTLLRWTFGLLWSIIKVIFK